MRLEIPRECFLSMPAEITPDLARSRSDKMKSLFRVQMLGRSLSDTYSALSLLVDLTRDLVEYEYAFLSWAVDPETPSPLELSRGSLSGVAEYRASALSRLLADTEKPILISPETCAPPARNSLLDAVGATSLVSVPVFVGGQLMGHLQLLRSSLPGFEVEDAQLLRVCVLAFETLLENLDQMGRARDYEFLDGPTGLFNRRYFEQHLEREIDRARRNNVVLSVLLLEVDQLDRVLSQDGRTAAEALLQVTAGKLRQLCRKSDTLARFDGHRFAMILPKTGKDILPVVARRILDALPGVQAPEPLTTTIEQRGFSLSAAAYPEDGYSVESLLGVCVRGLESARVSPGARYHQNPSPSATGEDSDIFDAARVGMLGEPAAAPSRLLNLFARMCLDTVQADRVSIMVREEEELVLQVALGFEGQDEVVRTTRVPLSEQTISSWVAQRKEPLLVAGAEGFVNLPRGTKGSYRTDSFISFPLVVGNELLGVIHFSNRSDGQAFSQADVDGFRPLAEVMARHLALGKKFAAAQEDFLRNALFGLVDISERQIPGMENHSAEVARLAEATARRMGYGEETLARLRLSSRLHDLGNASFRSRVLAESRALSPRERALAQRHPLVGWRFLESMPLAEIDRDAILYHHEREDGSGYFGKKGTDIPATAKILAVADVFQALTSPRPYRPALPRSEALAYLEDQKGTLFDPGVIDALKDAVLASN